ncbi:hypothetical protein [Streptomyces bohaiensis]|uniref:MarR family transcriptional regulator n=1 Tax=Streptomyces bohaiensis TaxID=1431344 RepID=A0ABX1C2P7_9ACTN|nr:hypothetical protein [Streptomyces bohaiensis]NJQ13506.1 hypothetical protein [Streptomyces bohaiensis]
MRRRLRAAVHALLADGSLTGAQDAVRCAAAVLMAKTSAADLEVSRLTAEEMGRWLGVSGSTVSHIVRPSLHRGLTRTRNTTPPGESEWVLGIDWQLLPLVRARREGAAGDPLRLVKGDFAVLLRFVEGLCAPGWTDTPPGLLARRTGHHAATDRLALLLLALETRADGRVRLCGGATGSVDRTVATLARLGSWSPEEAGRILDRLVGEGVISVSAGRITVPAVAAAHALIARQARAAGRPVLPAPRPAEAPEEDQETAWRDQIVIPSEFMQVSPYKTPLQDPASFAGPHALHAPVAHLCMSADPGMCFSGEGRLDDCRLPERAREEGPTAADTDGPATAPGDDEAARGPLRGDKQDLPSTNDDDQEQEQPETGENHDTDRLQEREERPAGGTATDGPETTGKAAEGASAGVWRAASGGPAPTDIARIINGVPGLWDALPGPGQQHVAATRIRAALTRIRGQLAHTEAQPADLAARILFDRMTRRAAESGGIPAARKPLAWLTGRLLPQRPGCSIASCDDGYSVTTGDACPGCASRTDDGRALRHQAWTETIGELRPGTESSADQIAAYQRRLADLSAREQLLAAERAERHAVVAAERAARQVVLDAERAVREAARQALPCADCGAPESAGLCGTCHEGRRATQTLETAVRHLLAAAVLVHRDQYGTATLEGLDVSADAARKRLADEVDAATEPLRGSGLTGVALAASRRLTAQDLADGIRRDALRSVERLEVVAAEARRAGEAASRRRCGDLSPWDAAVRAGRAAAVDLLDRAIADLDSDPATAAAAPNTEPEEEAWTCAADDCDSEPVTAAGLCGRHLVARSGTARRSAAPRPAVAADDRCTDECGRPALRTGPYCRRCHTAHVREIEVPFL